MYSDDGSSDVALIATLRQVINRKMHLGVPLDKADRRAARAAFDTYNAQLRASVEHRRNQLTQLYEKELALFEKIELSKNLRAVLDEHYFDTVNG